MSWYPQPRTSAQVAEQIARNAQERGLKPAMLSPVLPCYGCMGPSQQVADGRLYCRKCLPEASDASAPGKMSGPAQLSFLPPVANHSQPARLGRSRASNTGPLSHFETETPRWMIL